MGLYTSGIREANSAQPDHASRDKHGQMFNRLAATPVISSPLNYPSIRSTDSSPVLEHSTTSSAAWILYFQRPLVGWCPRVVFVSFALFVSGLWRSPDRHYYHPIPLSSHLSVPYEPVLDYLDIQKFRRYFLATFQNEFRSPRRRCSQLQAHAVSLQHPDLYPASEQRCGSRCVPTTMWNQC